MVNRTRLKLNFRWMSEQGFTLVELLVSAGLTLFVLGVVYSVYRVQTRTVKSQESRSEAQEYGRAVLDMMVRDIRNAGYFPAVGGACGVPANTGGIVAAGAQNFQFVLDANGDGLCTAPNNEIFAYAFAGADITRAVDGTPAQNLTIGNATNLQFIYYPRQTGAGAPPPPYCYAAAGDLTVAGVVCSGIVTANLANIQRVTITLTIRSTSPDTEFGGGQLNATMTSNADLRNRGLL